MTQQTTDRALECQSVGTPEVGDGLKQLRLSPWGKVESTNGDFIVDNEGVREVLRTFAEHGAALPIDVEHETLPERQPATGSRGAIGWIEKVFAETGKGLFALVKWSDAGKALILSDAFRYLSPVFVVRKEDRKVIAIHSAAITNKPALFKVERLAASQNAKTDAGHTVDIGDIADLLGVECRSGEGNTLVARCHAKLKALLADDVVAIAQSVRTALGLPSGADKDAVAVALSVRTSGGAESVELAAMKQAESQRTATAMVQGYVGQGKLNPNDKPALEAATRLAMSDPSTLESIFKNMTPQCPPGRTNPPTGRQTTISLAEREYRSNVGHQRATSLVAFVSNALREKGLPKLTEIETSELSIA
jgi:hypothetical protein